MTVALEEKPAEADGAREDADGITELEKFEPTRVDGVDVPANGFPILMLKSLVGEPARAQASADTIQEGHIAAVMTESARPEAVASPAETRAESVPAPGAHPASPAPAKLAAQPAAAAVKARAQTVTVDLPADVSVAFSPRDLAHLTTFKQRLAVERSAPDAEGGEAGGDAVKRDFDPHTGGGVDRDKIPAEDFADPEHRAFPIVIPKDVADIAPNLNHPNIKGDPQKIKSRAIAIAHRKGPKFVAQIPDSWTGDGHGDGAEKSLETHAAKDPAPDASESEGAEAASTGADEAVKAARKKPAKAKKPFPGAAPPFTKKDDAADSDAADGEDSGADSAADDDADAPASQDGDGGQGEPAQEKTKKAKSKTRACPDCQARMAKGAKFCSDCGSPMAKAKQPFPADADVEAAIDRLERDADAALTAQANDPDAATHPADRAVALALENVKDDIEAAAAAQDKDEATDTAAGHHAAKSAAQGPATPAPYHVARLHDATCAAYHGDDATTAHPALAKGIGQAVDPDVFAAAIGAALGSGDSTSAATALPALTRAYRIAAALKAAEPGLLADAMDALRKAFADAYPDAHPKPGAITPGAYRRPYLTAGRATENAAPGQKPRVPLASHVPDPNDFTRPLITAGREAASPGSAVKDARAYYTNAAREKAKGALAAMHDYIAGQHPDLCPMSTAADDGEDAQPGAMGTSLTTSAPTPRTLTGTSATATPGAVEPRRAASVVTPGPGRTHQAAKAARKKEKQMAKAATPQQAPPTVIPAGPAVDEDTLTRVLSGVLDARLDTVTKTLGDLAARITDIESSPDPAQMTPRNGAALTKTRNDSRQVPAGGDEAARTERLVRLVKQAKSSDQGISLPALDELMKTAGRELAVKLLE